MVRRQQRRHRRVRVPGLGIDGDLRIEQRHRGERKHLDRCAGELDVERQVGEIVQRQQVFARADRTRHRQPPIGQHRLEIGHDRPHQRRALLLTKILQDALEPFDVGTFERDPTRPFLALCQLLETLRQVGGLHLFGVIGRRVVDGVDAVPAPIGIACLRENGLGFRKVHLRQHLRRHLVGVGNVDDVERRPAGARFDRHTREQRGIVAADVVELDAGGILENLEQGQAFLLVGRRVDGERPFGLGRRQQGGIEPGM